MDIENYFHIKNTSLSFTRQHASDFAKIVASDFNPIHDVEAKRFCVPGDLIFAVIIHHYGLYKEMTFRFSGMVRETSQLLLPDCNAHQISINDVNEKKYLDINCAGKSSNNQKLIESLTCSYVKFSGQVFPHILLPLMRQENVMMNPDRPLIIYDSISLSLDTLDAEEVTLELTNSRLDVNGKRGDVTLDYAILSNGEILGSGQKNMIVSGLRGFDDEEMSKLLSAFNRRKDSYFS